jgi:hypothetical protein
MQDFDRLIARFRQFGGMRLVWQYAKMGVLWLGIKEIIRCILHGRSLKAVYPVVTKLVDQELVNQYDTQSEIATIREHGSLRYGASAYDNANDNNFSQRRDAENQGSTVSLDNNLAESKLSQDNISIPSDNSQSASLRKEQSASSKLRKDSEPAQRLSLEASAEDLNQRASASALNLLNQRSDLNSEASAEVLNQRGARLELFKKLGLKEFAGAVMYVMREVFAMPEERMLCRPDEKRGRKLLEEIMIGGNFGKFDERYNWAETTSGSMDYRGASYAFARLRHNFQFLKDYPSEVLWEPVFRVYHWVWRKFQLWKFE